MISTAPPWKTCDQETLQLIGKNLLSEGGSA